MAYINAEDVKAIRNALKERFGKRGFKFSVRKEHHSSLHVAIMQSPVMFMPVVPDHGVEGYQLEALQYQIKGHLAGHAGINHFHLQHYENAEILEEILQVIKTGAPNNKWFDKSDSMTDYFHTAFYINMAVGKWDRPCVYTGK